MTDDELRDDLAALQHHLDNRVEVWRVVIDGDGTVVGRIYRGSFVGPPGWEPPSTSIEQLITAAKGTRTD